MQQVKRALLSVSDKTGLYELAAGLVSLDIKIISTGGTAAFLQSKGIPVINVSEITGYPEMLDGRVKTLHPNIHGGILADRSKQEHVQTLKNFGIEMIDLVVINLYPFVATIQKDNVTLEQAIENIDIGGPAMIRSSAKNHASVAIVTDPADYALTLNALETNNNSISELFLKYLAIKAFSHTSKYDDQISNYLKSTV